ncbi:N-terminal Xaa-Pro-Lys N-methyltransferase 1, partial [Apaloderma vittatum]
MTSEVVENEFEFYSKAEKSGKTVPAAVDGMLGGYGHISSIDINSSRKFLQRFLRVEASAEAWVGWSWIEPVGHKLDSPRLKLPPGSSTCLKIREIPNHSLLVSSSGNSVLSNLCFAPPGHLTDNHLSDFLKRCRAGLRPNGIVVIKDNMAQEGVIMDDVDSSVCRD